MFIQFEHNTTHSYNSRPPLIRVELQLLGALAFHSTQAEANAAELALLDELINKAGEMRHKLMKRKLSPTKKGRG